MPTWETKKSLNEYSIIISNIILTFGTFKQELCILMHLHLFHHQNPDGSSKIGFHQAIDQEIRHIHVEQVSSNN